MFVEIIVNNDRKETSFFHAYGWLKIVWYFITWIGRKWSHVQWISWKFHLSFINCTPILTYPWYLDNQYIWQSLKMQFSLFQEVLADFTGHPSLIDNVLFMKRGFHELNQQLRHCNRAFLFFEQVYQTISSLLVFQRRLISMIL